MKLRQNFHSKTIKQNANFLMKVRTVKKRLTIHHARLIFKKDHPDKRHSLNNGSGRFRKIKFTLR